MSQIQFSSELKMFNIIILYDSFFLYSKGGKVHIHFNKVNSDQNKYNRHHITRYANLLQDFGKRWQILMAHDNIFILSFKFKTHLLKI